MVEVFGLKAELDLPYFTSFRKPTSTSSLTTFIVPPFTTIRGLLSNALGLSRDNYSLQEKELKIGIEIKRRGNKNTELSKILKLIGRERAFKCRDCGNIIRRTTKKKECDQCGGELKEIPNYKRRFSSSPMYREFLTSPVYNIYLIGKQKLVEKLKRALKNPCRPLYLGNSENLVSIRTSEIQEVKKNETKYPDTVIEGIHPNSIIEKMPYKFHKKGRRYQLEAKTVSIPKSGYIETEKPIDIFQLADKMIDAL